MHHFSLDRVKNAFATQPFTDMAARTFAPWVTIFMLHRIHMAEVGVQGLNQDYLRHCLKYLKDAGYQFISVEDAIARSLANNLERKKWVAFTLDDGCFEQIQVAAPLFKQFDCPSTCFLISGYVDGSLWPWDYKLQHLFSEANQESIEIDVAGKQFTVQIKQPKAYELVIQLIRAHAADQTEEIVTQVAVKLNIVIPTTPPPELSPTSWEQVRAAEKLGMQFGAHSISHRNLSALTDAELDREISISIDRLHTECKRPARVFCYPSGKIGEFDDRAINILKKKNVVGALSAEPGYLYTARIKKSDELYRIPRMAMPKDFETFKLYVSWAQYMREKLATL